MIDNLIIIIGITLLCVIGGAFWIWFMYVIGVFEEEKRDMFGMIVHEKDRKRDYENTK